MGLLRTQSVELEPGEVEVARTAGCTLRGGLSWVGGDLVLTDRRLIFTPLKVKHLATLLRYGLKPLGYGAALAVGLFEAQIRQKADDLDLITDVVPGQSSDVLHPPSVVVQRGDGTRMEFGVLASRFAPPMAKAHTEARERFLAEVRTLLRA